MMYRVPIDQMPRRNQTVGRQEARGYSKDDLSPIFAAQAKVNAAKCMRRMGAESKFTGGNFLIKANLTSLPNTTLDK